MGQAIQYGHASVRNAGRPPIPEDAYQEQFATLVNNDVDAPRVARSSVSCRTQHREQRWGHYYPGLDANGIPKLRTGFMIQCQTSSDCYSRCPVHPLTGMSYVCTKNAVFYSHFVINKSVTEEDFALNTALPPPTSIASAQAQKDQYKARKTWVPLPGTKTSYLSNEPGDDQFDVVTNQQMGVCTDVRYDFQHTNCESLPGSAAMLGLIGCTAKLGYVTDVMKRSGKLGKL